MCVCYRAVHFTESRRTFITKIIRRLDAKDEHKKKPLPRCLCRASNFGHYALVMVWNAQPGAGKANKSKHRTKKKENAPKLRILRVLPVTVNPLSHTSNSSPPAGSTKNGLFSPFLCRLTALFLMLPKKVLPPNRIGWASAVLAVRQNGNCHRLPLGSPGGKTFPSTEYCL